MEEDISFCVIRKHPNRLYTEENVKSTLDCGLYLTQINICYRILFGAPKLYYLSNLIREIQCPAEIIVSNPLRKESFFLNPHKQNRT